MIMARRHCGVLDFRVRIKTAVSFKKIKQNSYRSEEQGAYSVVIER